MSESGQCKKKYFWYIFGKNILPIKIKNIKKYYKFIYKNEM